MSNGDIIPNYIGMFRIRIEKLRKKIKIELTKNKKDRNKEQLKIFLVECKRLLKVVKEVEKNVIEKCPHCLKEIEKLSIIVKLKT